MTDIPKSKIYSEVIKDFGWHEDVLNVTFTKNSRYEYYDVPEPVYELFEKSYSKGSFFHENIRGQYPYAKLVLVAA